MMKNIEIILAVLGIILCLAVINWQANKVVNAPCPQGQVKVQVRTMQGPAVACIPR